MVETILISIISAIISFVIFFYLIRNATKSAMENVLPRYAVPNEILEAINKQSGAIQNQNEILEKLLLSSTSSPAHEETKPHEDTMTSEEKESSEQCAKKAHLRKLPDSLDFECSACGYRQPEKRKICFKCGIAFEDHENAYLVEGPDDYHWECSQCGTKQRKDRRACLKCGVVFPSNDALVRKLYGV